MNMALEGLNFIISYFSNSGFWEVAPYTDISVKEAPVQGVGFSSRNGEGMSRHRSARSCGVPSLPGWWQQSLET